MNRVAVWQESQSEVLQAPPEFDPPFECNLSKTVFVPLKYEERHSYPLLVWLHDEGEDESAMRRVAPRISLRNFVSVGIRGSLRSEFHPKGFTWEQSDDGIDIAARGVISAIFAMKLRYNIEPNHVFIAGSGVGGTMALRIAHDYADHFAGCASIGGGFPRSLRPLRCINRSRGLNVMMANSDAFTDYPTEDFCDDLRLMFSAGTRLLVREYDEAEDIYRPILSDVNRWLMGIVTEQFLFESEEVAFDTSLRN